MRLDRGLGFDIDFVQARGNEGQAYGFQGRQVSCRLTLSPIEFFFKVDTSNSSLRQHPSFRLFQAGFSSTTRNGTAQLIAALALVATANPGSANTLALQTTHTK